MNRRSNVKKLIASLLLVTSINTNAKVYYGDAEVALVAVIFSAAALYLMNDYINKESVEAKIPPPPDSTVSKYGSEYVTIWDPQCVCYKKELSN